MASFQVNYPFRSSWVVDVASRPRFRVACQLLILTREVCQNIVTYKLVFGQLRHTQPTLASSVGNCVTSLMDVISLMKAFYVWFWPIAVRPKKGLQIFAFSFPCSKMADISRSKCWIFLSKRKQQNAKRLLDLATHSGKIKDHAAPSDTS